MGMIKKSITVTAQQERWIQSLIAKGLYASDSEIFRELIRERQLREEQSEEEMQKIRQALIEGEESGFSDRTPEEIMHGVMKRKQENGC